jgi:two-component system, response regulator PdtaR
MELIAHRSPAIRRPVFYSPDDRVSGEGTGIDPPRILIVEDDYIVGLEIEAGLADAGFEVVGNAKSAEEAVRLATREHPMLAVMDIRLAGRSDGIEAALEMFNVSGLRCIFVTAHDDPGTRARAENAAPLGWLPKPYQLDTLISMIHAAITELKKSRS